MNETNIKHGYTSMAHDARCANFKSKGTIDATRGAILKPGAQHWGPPKGNIS